MDRSVQDFCADISELSFEIKQDNIRIPIVTTTPLTPQRKKKDSKSTRAKSAKPKPRPVNEQFCSKVNQYKFSIPITLNTARNIETTFTKERIRKLIIK